jgi:hypothetical protein
MVGCRPGQLRSAPELAATEVMADLLACLQLLLPHLASLPGQCRLTVRPTPDAAAELWHDSIACWLCRAEARM